MSHLQKKQDWRRRLAVFANQETGKAFEWGTTNCVSLALRAIDVQCESNLSIKYLRYLKNERIATAWAIKHGIDGFADLFLKHGGVMTSNTGCTDGFIIMIEQNNTLSANVIVGHQLLSSTPLDGVGYYGKVDTLLKALHETSANYLILGVR